MRGLSRGYLGRRLGQVPLTVAGILLASFLLLHLAPGDPVLAVAGESGDAGYYEAMRARFGLDDPLPVRLGVWASRTLRGDLGHSFVQGRPVARIVAERLPATLLLAGTALLLSVVLGVGAGIVAAARRGRPAEAAVTVATLGLYAAPSFWLAQLAMLALAHGAGWFPVQGMTTPGAATAALPDLLHHLALPALVLGAHEAAAVARLVHRGVVHELGTDHVRTARAKGAGPSRVYLRHALPGALLPVVTVVGHRVGRLVAGATLVEVVFAWPGLGRLVLEALQTRDLPVLMGVFLVVAGSVVVANLVTDLVYGALDPRVRYG